MLSLLRNLQEGKPLPKKDTIPLLTLATTQIVHSTLAKHPEITPEDCFNTDKCIKIITIRSGQKVVRATIYNPEFSFIKTELETMDGYRWAVTLVWKDHAIRYDNLTLQQAYQYLDNKFEQNLTLF